MGRPKWSVYYYFGSRLSGDQLSVPAVSANFYFSQSPLSQLRDSRLGDMGSSYYNEELKQLSRLLRALPDSIPLGDAHNFLDYVPDPEKVQDYGCVKSVLNRALELSFGSRRTPAGETILTVFKSRGTGLEEVVAVLRDHITGNAGQNLLLTLWVDDLTKAALDAIEKAGL